MLRRLLLKKDSGVLDQVLPLFVGIVMLTIVFGMMLGAMESIQTKNRVDLVARRAILLLETYGYIEDGMKAELKDQLEAADIIDVQIFTKGYREDTREWGTISETMPAAYGQKVEVTITGKLHTTDVRVPGETIFSTTIGKDMDKLHVVRVSTSKN